MPVRQPSLAAQTEQLLHERLVGGDFAPGDRLPTEHELARQFQVSRATIRSAITGLVRRGLVVQRHGVGTFAAAGIGLTNDLAGAVDLAELLERHGIESTIVFDDVAITPVSHDIAFPLGIEEGADAVVACKRFMTENATLVYVVNAIAVDTIGAALADDIIDDPTITEPLFQFLETRAGRYTAAQLARLQAELASDIDHPGAPTDASTTTPVMRIDETGLDEHHHPIWHSRTWFPPGAMSFELMRLRSRTFA